MDYLRPATAQQLPALLKRHRDAWTTGNIDDLLPFTEGFDTSQLERNELAVVWRIILKRNASENPELLKKACQLIESKPYRQTDGIGDTHFCMLLETLLAGSSYLKGFPLPDVTNFLYLTTTVLMLHLANTVSEPFPTYRMLILRYKMVLSHLFIALERNTTACDQVIIMERNLPAERKSWDVNLHKVLHWSGLALDADKQGASWIFTGCYFVLTALGRKCSERMPEELTKPGEPALAVDRFALLKKHNPDHETIAAGAAYVCLTCYGHSFPQDDRFSARKTDPVTKQFKVCAECECAMYCSKECAKQDWKNGHKLNCRGRQQKRSQHGSAA